MTISGGQYSAGGRIGDRYRVLRDLGSGADGQVYLVTDEYLATEVAIKLLKPKPNQAATWDEAQLLEQLKSEFLLPVFNADILHPSDLRYITTAYMPGGDLHAKAADGATTQQAVRWAVQIAHGLDRIHAAGLVHRDVKPANVFLDDKGDALLGDLGKAHRLGSTGTAPRDGTPATVAPEVLAADGVCTVRSDIYSLGATVFYLLIGKFAVDTRGDTRRVFERVTAGDKRRLRDLGPHVSQGLAQIVEQCLSVDPAARPGSALEVANRLAAAKCHPRVWRLLEGHGDHLLCLEGGRKGAAKPVTVCSVPTSPAYCDVHVTLESGVRVRRHELSGIRRERLLQELRRLAGKV
jgi:serine/threonine-protein kinase